MFNLASRKFFFEQGKLSGTTLYGGGLDTPNRGWGDTGLSGFGVPYEYTQVGTDSNWSKVACGPLWTLAIKENGTLWACGQQNRSDFFRGGYDPMGLGANEGLYNELTQVGTDSDWSDVWTGHFQSFALKTDGTLWSWGHAYFSGTLGLGSVSVASTPQKIGSATNWTENFSVGGAFTCYAIASNSAGELYGWGRNNSTYRVLGLPNTSYTTPQQLTGATGWTSVAAGGEGYFTAAIKNGELWTCGRNHVGQLGLGDTLDRTSYTRVGTDNNWLQVKARSYNCYAIKTDGTLWGWGSGSDWQLGQSTNSNALSPVQIGSDTDWDKILAANNWYDSPSSEAAFFRKTDGSLYVLGWVESTRLNGSRLVIDTGYPNSFLDSRRESITQVLSITGCKDASIGDDHSVVIKSDGTLIGAGPNHRIGLGFTSIRKMSDDTDWYKILGGRDPANGESLVTTNTFIVKNDGTLWGAGRNTNISTGSAWGYGDSSTTTAYLNFTQIGTDTFWKDVLSLSNSYFTTLMVKGDGTLWYTGRANSIPEYSNNGRTTSWTQYGSDTWKWVSINWGSGWGIKSDGTLWSWGANSNGELGLGDTTNRYTSVTQVGSATNWSKIWNSGGGNVAVFGLRDDGTLWSWGQDRLGSLGTNQANNAIVSTPQQIGSDTNWVDLVSTYYGTTFALKSNGQIWTWGDNTHNSTYTYGDYTTPVQFGTDSDYVAVFGAGRHTGIFFKSDGTIVSNADYAINGDVGKSTDVPRPAMTDIESHPFTEYSETIKDRVSIAGTRVHLIL